VTEPKSTLGLSAPVIITFDATGLLKIGVRQYTSSPIFGTFGDITTGWVSHYEYTDKEETLVSLGALAVTLQIGQKSRLL
jgi:hypothetical protein